MNYKKIKDNARAEVSTLLNMLNKKQVKDSAREIKNENGFLTAEFIKYLETKIPKIWPDIDLSKYKNLKIVQLGSPKSEYVALQGVNSAGVNVTLGDAYISGEGTTFGTHQVRKNQAIKLLTDLYKRS